MLSRASGVGLTDDVASGLESQLHDAFVLVWRSQMEDGENIFPAWADVCSLGVHHLGDTSHHHVSDGGWPDGAKYTSAVLHKLLPELRAFLIAWDSWMRDNTLFAHRRTARVDLMDTLCCSVSMAACQSVGGFILALLLFPMNGKRCCLLM